MRHPKVLAAVGIVLAILMGSACGAGEQQLTASATDQALYQLEASQRAQAGEQYVQQQQAIAQGEAFAQAFKTGLAQAAAAQQKAAADKATRINAAKAASQKASRSSTTPRGGGAPVAVGGDVWGALARCESGGNPRAVGGGGRYFGAFQFSLGSWHSAGMSGNPVDYDYGTQLAVAKRWQAGHGWGQWPACARRLGLR